MNKLYKPKRKLFLLVTLCVLSIELLIMFVIPAFPSLSIAQKAFLDAFLLTVLVFPILYFLLFRPLLTQTRERSKAYEQLLEIMEKVEQGKKEWEYTVDSLPELITLLDEKGRSIRANRTIERWGIEKLHKVRGQEYHELIHRHCNERSCSFYVLWQEAWGKALQGDPADFEIFDKKLDKSLLVSVRPQREKMSESDRNFTVVVVHDITSSQKMEEMLVQRQKALQAVYDMSIAMDRSVEDIIGRVVSHITLLIKPYKIVVTVKEGIRERDITDMYANNVHGEGAYSIAGAPSEKVYESGEISSITAEIGGFIHNDTGFLNENIKTYLGVPVKNSLGDVLGVVSVMEKEGREYDKAEVHLVEIFARYIGTILEQETISNQLRSSEKMKVFGQLAAGVAHEVRNPLNAIMAITEALAMDLGDHKEFGPFLEHIQTQVNRLSDLMRELLDLGKPIELSNFHRISISDICSVTIDMWEQSALSKKHKVTLIKPSDHNDMAIIGNSQQLQQVFFNLIENAAQHSPEGSEIVLSILEPDSDHVITRVTDNGTGIPEEHITAVFEPFFTMRRKGTGMGLSLVKRFVEAHGGVVTVWNNTSAPGCTVEVSLPLAGDDIS